MVERFTRNKLIIAILSIAFGIYMVIAQKYAVDGIIRIAGYVSIGAAVIYLLYYFFGPEKDQVQLGYAGLMGLAGLLLLLLAPAIRNSFPIMAGILLIVAGVGNLTGSNSIEAPLLAKLFPILTIVLGILIIIHPGQIVDIVVLLTGIGMIWNGVNELFMVRSIRNDE